MCVCFCDCGMIEIIKLNWKVVASFGLESTLEMVCTGELWKD